jgi:membrane protease YdiL (CAAX protease family)
MARKMRPVAAALVAITTLLTAGTSYFAFAPLAAGTATFWGLAAGPPLLLGVVATVWALREDLLRSWLSPRWGDFTRGVVGAGLLFAAAWAFAHGVAPVGSSREIWLAALYGQLGDPQRLRAQGALVGGAFVLVALAEELVWRGMVTHLLAEALGSRAAWLGAAVLYAVAYIPTMWSLRAGTALNPIVVVAALAGGLLWGGMARAFGTLVPSIVAHAFFDWVAVMMLPLWGGRLDF